MSITSDTIRHQLNSSDSLSPLTHLQVDDISAGCGTSFAITAVTPAFTSKSLLDRHRIIHKALEPHMSTIHALKLKCLTPDKFFPHNNPPTTE